MTNSMTDNTEKSRFEYEKNGHTVFANYRISNDTLYIDYVEAPQPLRGTGAAGELMTDIVEHARQKSMRIQPICGYAAAWLQRHNEHNDVLAQANG